MTNSNETCTCPSGDGSLRHPCPAHPNENELKVGKVVENLECRVFDNNGQEHIDNAINLIKKQAEQLEAAQKEIERLSSLVCRSCNGHGLLSRVTQDGSHEDMDCPDCNAAPKPEEG